MQSWEKLALSSVLAMALAGCGQTDSPSTAAAGGSSNAAGSKSPEKSAGAVDTSNLGPQEIVKRYLTAVQAGDEQGVGSLLTEVARRKTTELNIAVAPPGNDTASFSVGDLEYITPTKDTAHVACMWTDIDEQGKPQTLNIIWVVRHEPIGWRIAGMVTRMAKDQPLLVLNFEDPEEVIRRQSAAQEDLARTQSGHPSGPAAGTQALPAGSNAPLDRSVQPRELPPDSNSSRLREARDPQRPQAVDQR